MFIKKLRQQHFYSQEHLSEITGLSLRTIQRVEHGHRVSYSSLRKLSAAFDIDVDKLEREIYAMNENTDEFKETPLWIRLVLGKGWFFGGKQRYEKMTSLFMGLGIVCFMAWISLLFWIRVPALHDLMLASLLRASVSLLLAAIFSMYCIHLGDKYKAWQVLEIRQAKKSSGMIVGSFLGLILAVNAYSSIDSFRTTETFETPPWRYLDSNENDPAFQRFLAQSPVGIRDTDGGRKLIRHHESGIRFGVNAGGQVDRILLSNNRNERAPEALFPLSLKRDMTRGDVDNLIGEPFLVSDVNFGNLKVQYLIDGNKLGLGTENVILEILYRANSMSLTDLNAQLSAISVIQP